MAETSVTFGPFVFLPDSGLLRRDGEAVALGHRSAALLHTLIEAQGKVVSKAVLMERGWPATIVEEGNLPVQIASLRKLLGLKSDGKEWISTVPRVGYRLLLEATPAKTDTVPDRPAVAVLPFDNLGKDDNDDYFADGVTTDIIAALMRFKSFKVVSRNCSFAYKGRTVDTRQVARELGVQYVLEGSISRQEKRLRITVQLVDGARATHLWADRFEGKLDDIFDFQDRITERIASLVEPAIEGAEIERSRRERPGSFAIYDIYLRSLSYLVDETAEGNAAAYALLIEALVVEPDNAMVLAHAAWALEHRHTMGWPSIGPDDKEKCVEYARRGLQHAAGDPRVMAQCGMALLQTGKDYDAGMAVILSAAATNPNDLFVTAAAGVAILHCGPLDKALEYFHRGLQLGRNDPDARFFLSGIAMAQIILGNYEEALEWAAQSLAINARFDATYWMLIAGNAHLGRMDEAHRHLEKLMAIAPGVSLSSIKRGQPAKDQSRIGPVLEGLRLAGLREK
ncbi:winged helix-turn-helix domain-containing tetratricopeptide repeat protein [Pararhizobium sp. BT-229]|uniref:winged helix-turn-helix domain-containing tetratricopeptide repeat protein n=1 Tax=Pararhizobium sp. BT-229 TaxID=2986923 RepID=UPI0021F7AF27|nr:winged helix-turn-helix domain-containing tetratricopeptide repeat protein [Pararhizobium sp. BT-229]MCV9963491.1 winged helix-turn-helix domain-containing tetratricopeptide repeat protein [Pararhizobium sp. BT-229]